MTREEMKRLARVCAEKERPRRMRGTKVITDRYAHDSEYVVVEGRAVLYRRRIDIKPRQYPIIRFDRVSGAIKSITMATPTAPLRRA